MQEKQYYIEKPTLLNVDTDKILSYQNDETVLNAIAQTEQRYLSWEEFKNKSWVPTDRRLEIWTAIKWMRRFSRRPSPIVDTNQQPFFYSAENIQAFLHKIDMELGGALMGGADFSENDRRDIIRRNLMEESIASSQLEGSNTTREAAKKMLRENREPRNKDERMIVNNHRAMRRIEEELKHEDLSIDLLHELHRDITHKTIEEKYQGVLRNTLNEEGKRLVIKPWDDFTVAYTAPDREFVEKELKRLINFANAPSPIFIHPLIKGIILHFWIGFLHPYEDGNGRLARIIFYWYMLRNGYWAFSYLSLSEMILKAPKQYAMAYIYTEQDDNDLNYFIRFNITKLEAARKNLDEYMRKRATENIRMSDIIHKGLDLNHRQLKLLQHLVKDSHRLTTLREYHGFNPDIGRVTASTDLAKLVAEGYLRKIRHGRNIHYAAEKKTHNLLKPD